MLLKTLSKKYVKEILSLLNHNKLHFEQIQRETGINSGNLTNLLKELRKEGLVENIKQKDVEGGRLKSYYFLTSKGKKALTVLNIIDKLDNIENSNNIAIHYTIVKGDNNKVVSGNNISNSSLHL